MKLGRLLPILLLFFCWQGLSAQDIHYTLFDYAPLRSNPALTGAFSGSVRVGGVHRSQWFAVNSFNDYGTSSFYADAPIIKGFRDQDWVGVGLFVVSDRYGDASSIQTSGGLLSASYHFANKKRTNVLTIGGQYGQMQRRLDLNSPISQETIDVGFGGGGIGTNQGEFAVGGMDAPPEPMYTDISAGLLYRSQIDKESHIEIGLAGLHLNSPDNSLSSTGGGGMGIAGAASRGMTVVSHLIYSRELNNNWSINPKLYFQSTEGGGSEMMAQAWVGKRIKPDFKLNFGLGGRVGDAAHVLVGADYKDLRMALAYDLNLSGANTITNYQGGFELGAYYIIKIYKKPELPPTILCPRF